MGFGRPATAPCRPSKPFRRAPAIGLGAPRCCFAVLRKLRTCGLLRSDGRCRDCRCLIEGARRSFACLALSGAPRFEKARLRAFAGLERLVLRAPLRFENLSVLRPLCSEKGRVLSRGGGNVAKSPVSPSSGGQKAPFLRVPDGPEKRPEPLNWANAA